MRADTLSTYVLYIWLLASALAMLPLVYWVFFGEEILRDDYRHLIKSAISLIIPTTGLAFSKLLVDQRPSQRHVRKNLLPVIFLGVVSAPAAILVTSLVYRFDQVPPDAKLFEDASLIIPISTAAMFYVFGVAMKERS